MRKVTTIRKQVPDQRKNKYMTRVAFHDSPHHKKIRKVHIFQHNKITNNIRILFTKNHLNVVSVLQK